MVRCPNGFLHRDKEVNGRDPLPGIFSLYLRSSIHFVALNYCEQSFVRESFVAQTMKGGDSMMKQTRQNILAPSVLKVYWPLIGQYFYAPNILISI